MKRPFSSKQNNKKVFLENEEQDKISKKTYQKDKSPFILKDNDNSAMVNKNYITVQEGFEINEQLYLLENLWDSLGIIDEYRITFLKNIQSITDSEKKDIIILEKNNLKKLKNSLYELKKETIERDNNISVLKKLNNSLDIHPIKENFNDDILKEIITIIKKLRKNALNIVSKIISINKILNKYINYGKIDLNKINQEYSYNPKYINKMKDDLSFLQNSKINKFIEMNNSEIDAFLTNCAPNPNKFNYRRKIEIPMSDDYIKSVKDFRYLLLQETLLNEPNNNNNQNNINSFLKPNNINNNRYNNDYFIYNSFNNNNSIDFEQNKISNLKNVYGYNSVKKMKKKQIFIGDFPNKEKQLYDFKNKLEQKNYDNLFFKNQKKIKPRYKINLGNNNKFNFNSLIYNYFLPKNKILINRKVVKPLQNNEFESDYFKHFQSDYDLLEEKEKTDIIKSYNFEEEIQKYKKLAEKEEQKRIKLEKDINNLQNKLKEANEKYNNNKSENDKGNKNWKKIEKELNDKILLLQIEKEEMKKNLRSGMNHEEIQGQKNMKKIEEELKEKIKILEEKIKKEEFERKNKEKEIEKLKFKIKNDEDKRNEEKENERQKADEKEKKLKKLEEEKNEEIKRYQDKIQELEKDNNYLVSEKNKLNNDYNKLKEEKMRIEKEYYKLKQSQEKQKEIDNIDNDNDNEFKLLSGFNNNSQIEKNSQKDKNSDIKKIHNYTINFYKGNISNLVNLIIDKIPLEKIPDFLKRTLMLNESLFKEEYYLKGLFPKIIISTDGEGENKIKGLCSLYYESNENLLENLILRINSIYAIEEWEIQIIMMIQFIKKNMKFKKLEIYVLYDKIENKFVTNKEAKELFQKKLGFKWLCVVGDEKHQQRYIKLFYANEEEKNEYSLNNINNNENITNTLCEKNNFYMDNLTIITVDRKENADILKNIIYNESNNNKHYKINYNKFINPNPIYSLLFLNPKLNKNFKDLSKRNELKEMNEKLWRFVVAENDWNNIEQQKKLIKNIKFDIDNSIYKEIENYYKSNYINCICDLYKNNLSINFENIYSLLYEDLYYNRISTEKIKILRETRTNSLFFLIPSNDNTVLFYITEVNIKLKKLILESNKNIYEEFLEFQPDAQKELLDFSITSFRDISYIPKIQISASKTIYIPCFSINTHLFSYNFKEISKNINMTDAETNQPSYLTSVDEYINIKFNPDKNIENNFSVIPVEDKKTNVIIKDSFIIGIFANDIINNNKLPLLQFLYITKDNFLTKDNYNPNLDSP